MARKAKAVFGAAIVAVAIGACAGTGPGAVPQPAEPRLSLVESLRQQGYPQIRNVQTSAGGFVVDAVTDAGQPARILVDPATTQVVEILSTG